MISLVVAGFLLGIGFWLAKKATTKLDAFFSGKHEELDDLHTELDRLTDEP